MLERSRVSVIDDERGSMYFCTFTSMCESSSYLSYKSLLRTLSLLHLDFTSQFSSSFLHLLSPLLSRLTGGHKFALTKMMPPQEGYLVRITDSYNDDTVTAGGSATVSDTVTRSTNPSTAEGNSRTARADADGTTGQPASFTDDGGKDDCGVVMNKSAAATPELENPTEDHVESLLLAGLADLNINNDKSKEARPLLPERPIPRDIPVVDATCKRPSSHVSGPLLTHDIVLSLLRPLQASVFTSAEEDRIWSRLWSISLRRNMRGGVLDQLWDSCLMRTFDRYSGSLPDADNRRMLARAPRMPLNKRGQREYPDEKKTRVAMLRQHADHAKWEPTPFISFTKFCSGSSGARGLAPQIQEKGGAVGCCCRSTQAV